MTAPSLSVGEPFRERRLLLLSALAALLSHAALLLWLPLPATSQPAPRTSRPTSFDLSRTPIPPPPMPARPVPAVQTAERRRPVPVPEEAAPRAEPVFEPAAAHQPPAPVARFDAEARWQAAPPPPPDRVGEEMPGLIPPELLPGRAQPDYPPLAIKTRLAGRVVLRAVITRAGRVSQIEVLEAPRHDPGFVKAAIDAVSRWRYLPGRYRGEEVEVVMRVVVEFSLD